MPLSPVVSVILPNYNHALYLPQRIESILSQDFQDFELILLDDSSSDDSAEILRRYAQHPKVSHLILNEENSGSTFAQWNKGLALAKGEYIWIAESDDYAAPTFLSELMKALRSYPDSSIAFSGSEMVDAQGHPTGADWDHYKDVKEVTVRYSPTAFLQKRMLWKNEIYNASMVVFRKKYLQNIRPDYQTFRYCGDWLFWSEICRQGDVLEVRKKLNYFRQHANKVSPGAEKEGLYFSEGSKVIQHNIRFLHLSYYQKQVAGGRFLKRLKRQKALPKTQQESLFQQYQEAYGKNPLLNYLSILLYTFDKYCNLSHLQR